MCIIFEQVMSLAVSRFRFGKRSSSFFTCKNSCIKVRLHQPMGLGYLGERRLREVVIGEKVGRYRPHPVRRLGVRVGPGEVGQLVVTTCG